MATRGAERAPLLAGASRGAARRGEGGAPHPPEEEPETNERAGGAARAEGAAERSDPEGTSLAPRLSAR